MFPNNYVYPHYERIYADRDPLTSFCATIGECQQKFLLGGAFYSPNERLLPPSLNVIFPDGTSMQCTLLVQDTYMPSSGLTRRDVPSKKENVIFLAEKI